MQIYILFKLNTNVTIQMGFRRRWTLRSWEDIVLNMGKEDTVRRQRRL